MVFYETNKLLLEQKIEVMSMNIKSATDNPSLEISLVVNVNETLFF